MIKNSKLLDNYNKRYKRQRSCSYKTALKIYNSLLKEARHLGKIPSGTLMNKSLPSVRIARLLKSVRG